MDRRSLARTRRASGSSSSVRYGGRNRSRERYHRSEGPSFSGMGTRERRRQRANSSDSGDEMDWDTGGRMSDTPDHPPHHNGGGFLGYLRDAFADPPPKRRSVMESGETANGEEAPERGETKAGVRHDSLYNREGEQPKAHSEQPDAGRQTSSRQTRGRTESGSESTTNEGGRQSGRQSRRRRGPGLLWARSQWRRSVERRRAGNTSSEEESEGYRSGRPKNLYAPPQTLSEYDYYYDPPITNRSGAMQRGIPPKLPPFLENKMLLGDFLVLLPIEPLLEDMKASLVKYEDTATLECWVDYGMGVKWSDGPNALPNYQRGKMYCTDPQQEQMVAWTRTGEQAHALVTLMGQNSLSYYVSRNNISHGIGVLFLLDAAMRIGCSLHKGKWNELLKGLARSSKTSTTMRGPAAMFVTVPKDDAYLFNDGPTDHARGGTAANFRAAFGAMIYWPELRLGLTQNIRKCVRYALCALRQSEVVLATRVGKDRTCMTDLELQALSACFTASVVTGCAAAQFLYMALGRSLHPRARNEAYERVVDVEPLVHIPMGSEHLTRTESVCFSNLQETRRAFPSELVDLLVSTHVAVRSALTEIMSEYTEGYQSYDYDDNEARAIPSPNSDVPSAIVGTTMVLQRLLGYLNIMAADLVIAALYHGEDMSIWSYTFPLYAFLLSTCSPLYRPLMVDEFDYERRQALEELGLSLARGRPESHSEQRAMGVDHLAELRVLRLMSPAAPRDYLGEVVPLGEAIDGVREILFGLTAVDTTQRIISGRRAHGMGRSGRH